MANNPTIVAASLSDQDLKNSIDKLVKHVEEATNKMAGSMDSAVEQMKKKLGELGNVKIDFGGTSSGGVTKKVINDQRELEEQTKKTTQAAKEQKMTFDHTAQSQQVAIRSASSSFRNADTLQMMQTNLDLLREKLRDARQQYSSFIALAAHATTTGDKGLYQFATSGVRQYEQEVKSLIPQIRSMQTAMQQMGDVIAPQGHTIQNYVNSIGKVSPELKQLGEQIKSNSMSVERSNADMNNATSSANRYTEAIRKQAQAIRESAEWKQKGEYAMMLNAETGAMTWVSANDRRSVEEQLVAIYETENRSKSQILEQEKQQNESVRERLETERKVVDIESKRSQPKTFASYDDLRQSIAHVLGLQQSQVKLADAETASYNNLDKTLKQLTQAYYRLSNAERNSDQGKSLIASIHEVERAMQKIRSLASRPISLDSIIGINGKGGLSEKTLDDIAYKMQRLASYRSGLDVDSQKNEIKQVNDEYDRLKKKMDEVMNKNQQMVGSNNALGRSWNYMKNRLAFYFTVGASTQFIKNLIEVRSQYEMNERALGILINSAERGTQIFNELSQMALVSPYTLIELSNAAKQLTAYDIAANEVVDTTRRLADMASAVGVPMERLTYALGQIKAYGYLNSRDARMFANAGIPLVRELSKYYTELEGKMVSVGDVYDRMKKKAIDFNDVMSVVTKMTDEGGKFFDFQAKMADTLKVRLANLTLAWNNMLNDIGKSEQGVLTTGINLLKDFFLRWKDINRAVEDLVIVFGVLKAAQLAYYGMVLGTNKAIAIETVLGTKLSNVLRNLGTTMSTVLTSGATWWGLLAVAAGAAIVEVVRGNEAMKEFNKTLRENAKNTYNDLERFKEQYKELRESLYQTITDNNGKTIVTPQNINVDDAEKAWESVKEQIELSSHASDKYVGSLLQIKNISERLRQSFAVIDDIQSVSAAIKELGDGAIKLERDWSGWWNLWTLPDGTIGNLKDAHMWLGKIEEKYGSIEKARKAASGEDRAPLGIDKKYQDDAERWLDNYENELRKFREDLESTKESVLNFINAQGWSGNVNKVNETFKQITDNLIQQNQLDPEKAYTLQIEMEEARSKAAKEAQYIRLQDLRNAYMAEKDSLHKEEIAKEYEKEAEIYNNWNLYNGRQKVEWERFTKYLKEQHLSEMTAMFRGMNAKQIESLNFQEGKYADWVKRMVTNYAKSHKMSYDEAFNYLRNWVASANQWSIFIPLTISTDKNKTVMKTLEEADAAADKAWKDMQRLDKEIARLRKKGAKEVDENNITASEDDQRLTKALKERAAAEKDYNKAVSDGGESKKENAANTKAQKQAESELQKALKEELQLIDKVRTQYKKLTDAGVSRAVAMKTVTEQFGDSIKHINAVLGKNGLPKFDIKSFAGTDNPHEMMVMLKKQIDSAKKVKNIKPEEIKDLEIKYSEIKVDAEAYDATKIKKGLDNELGRLKDEYELAVELDANPELGNMFADMFDIDLDTLPRTAKEYADRYTKSLNKYFKQMGDNIELPNMLNLTRDDMEAFTEQIGTGELQQAYFDLIQKGYEATQEARKKEATDAIKEYDKLLQKYAEYQYKLTQIAKDANNERKALVVKFGTEEQKEQSRKIASKIEMSDNPSDIEKLEKQLKSIVSQIADKNKVVLQIGVAIDKKELDEGAKASFEEFQKSPEWVVATGNLAGLTDSALKGLISSIEEYKNKAKYLSPKQIKDINKALRDLDKERKKNNPFAAFAISAANAKERMEAFDESIKEVEGEIDRLSSSQDSSNIEETGKKIMTLTDRLRKLKQARENAGDIDATEIVANIQGIAQVAGQAVGMINDMVNAMSGDNWSEAQEVMNDTFSIIDKGGQGAAIGAQVGGGWGALIGGVAGGVMGAITAFVDNGNKKITASIKESETAVKRLENAYKSLQYAIDEAYGTAKYGAEEAAIANKKLQLAELKRQLELSKSRTGKHRDEDEIESLKGQVIDLEQEISKATNDIVNDLLGISSVGSAAEEVVSAMIDAFRNGEDYMKSFGDTFSDMIDNMIMKSIVSKVIGQRMEQMFAEVDEMTKGRASGWQANIESISTQMKENEDRLAELEASRRYWEDFGRLFAPEGYIQWLREVESINRDNAELQKQLQEAQDAYSQALSVTPDDVNSIRERVDGWKDNVKSEFETWMEAFGISLGDKKESAQLSALQQGISGITETTAGAIEAYMNGVSQQVYLQSDYMRQIVEILTMQSALTDDAKVATLSQMLMQLQASYQTQEAIRGILEGWSSPNGLAVRVEMN